jgi:hydroxyacylglutathione hydrolase
MSDVKIHQFPCLNDNYGCLVHHPGSRETVSIDAPEAAAVRQALDDTGWTLSHILVTHHHGDHTGGIEALKSKTQCTVIGPEAEATRIPGIDQTVKGGDVLQLLGDAVHVLDTPGHTLGHISYWLEHSNVAFVGDTLFSLGCGRVFEGSNEMMWESLERLAQLPPKTQIYCGHEYTQANGRFALVAEPQNAALQARMAEVEKLRAAGKATVPTTIAQELETNPFLRPHSPEIRANLMLPSAPDVAVFSELRERKNKA